MKNCTNFDADNPKKKHPFKIGKTLNEINKERKNQTLINPSYENKFINRIKNEIPYAKDINK